MATIVDLEHIKGKAELVNGRIVLIEPHGALPGYANSQIVFALGRYEDEYSGGQAFNGMPAYVVSLPHRGLFRGRNAGCMGRGFAECERRHQTFGE